MNRVIFTKKLCQLLQKMIAEGERPILDYIKRSAEEQNRLFKAGKSKCDGYKIRSAHQIGRAVDIYFCDQNLVLNWDKKRFERWHKEWEKLGGQKMISWDLGHFEL